MDESSDRELERYILKQVPFEKIPPATKALVENSKAKWKQYIVRYPFLSPRPKRIYFTFVVFSSLTVFEPKIMHTIDCAM